MEQSNSSGNLRRPIPPPTANISGQGASTQPPVPPRPTNTQNGYGAYAMNRFTPFSSYGGFNPGGYGFGGMGGYAGAMGAMGAYGGYGGYSTGMYGAGAYGAGNGYAYGGPVYPNAPPESELIRVAEERSRAAFQSIESFLQAVQSISMMLDSSYWALASSFRAVLSVAEHFSRLRFQLGTALSSLAIVRTLIYTVRTLLRWLGIEHLLFNPATQALNSTEDAWQQAQASLGSLIGSDSVLTPEALVAQAGKANWPIVAFFSVALGTPIVIYKLLQGITSPDQRRLQPYHGWARGVGEHFVAYANFDFAGDRSHSFAGHRELSFRAGDKLLIAPKELQGASKGWLLAARKGKIGLVPYNYLSQPYKVTPIATPTTLAANETSTDPNLSNQPRVQSKVIGPSVESSSPVVAQSSDAEQSN